MENGTAAFLSSPNLRICHVLDARQGKLTCTMAAIASFSALLPRPPSWPLMTSCGAWCSTVHVYPSQIPTVDTAAPVFITSEHFLVALGPSPPPHRASSWTAAELPSHHSSTTGARGSATSDARLAQGIMGSGSATSELALRLTLRLANPEPFPIY
jgi:hypothetical protein